MVSCSYIVFNIIFYIYLNVVIKGNYDTCYNVDEPEDVLLGEINQSQKDKYCNIPLYHSEISYPDLSYIISRVVKFIKSEIRMVVARGWREWGKWNCFLMGIEFQFCKKKNFRRLAAQ